MNLINFAYLTKLVYMSIRILGRFTIEDRKHTHNMRIYSKIFTFIKGRVNATDRSLEEGPSVVNMTFP